MSSTAALLLAPVAIGLLIVSYWLRSRVRRQVIYRPRSEGGTPAENSGTPMAEGSVLPLAASAAARSPRA